MREDQGVIEALRPALFAASDRTAALYRLTDRLYRAAEMREVYDAALHAIMETMACRRASVLLFDDHGVMRFVAWRGLSDNYRQALEGHSPWKVGDRDPLPIFVSDIDGTAESEAVKDAIKTEGIRALAFVPLVADGAVIGKFMTYYEEPRQFIDEERTLALTVARQVGFSLERNRSDRARQTAEQQLRASEERFRALTELAPAMMWLSDDKGRCLLLNQTLRTFWGVEADAVDEFDWRNSMHPEDAPRIGQAMFEAITNRTAVKVKGRYRNAAGEYRVLETEGRPRFSDEGTFLGLVGVNTDVTERERAEAHRDLLLGELNHRVKNTLTVVQSLARQTFKPPRSLKEATEAFEGRLSALARAHDRLTADADEVASLCDLAADVLRGRGFDQQRSRIAGPNVVLSSRQAMAVAMALHELFTNALKYGAFSNDRGLVHLEWALADSELQLTWREEGGPPIQVPTRRGFGSVVIERALSNVGGTSSRDFAPNGFICQICMPMPAKS